MATTEGSNKTMIVALVVVLAIIAIIFMMNYNKRDQTVGEQVGNTMQQTGDAISNTANNTEKAIDNATR